MVRTSGGDLVFFVNGVSQSVAASGIPPKVWAVVDLYGKCAAVTITDTGNSEQVRNICCLLLLRCLLPRLEHNMNYEIVVYSGRGTFFSSVA